MAPPIRILLVDDDEEILRIMQEALRIQGYEVVACAHNGREAVALYPDTHPHVVFMDIVMPVMDGYEASRRIRTLDPGARIAVLTGNPADPRARRVVEEGLAGTLIQKPVRLGRLRTIIESLLGGASSSLTGPSPFPNEPMAFETRL